MYNTCLLGSRLCRDSAISPNFFLMLVFLLESMSDLRIIMVMMMRRLKKMTYMARAVVLRTLWSATL